MNLKQAYDLFILSREEYCSPATVYNYTNTLRYFLEYMSFIRGCSIDLIDINSIVRSDLSSYTLYLRERPKFVNHPFHAVDEKGIAKRSIRTYQTDVRTFFNYLYDENFMKEHITEKYKLIKSETRLIVPLSASDVATIDDMFSSKTEMSARNLCIIHLMLDAGLRHGEVLNLTVSDVNFEHNYIFIRNGKGAKDRIVPLAPRLKKYLYTYFVAFRPHVKHDYFLCNVRQEQLTDDSVKSLFARIQKKLKLPRFYPHLLRHTFATAYMIQGGDLESLRIYMGHSDITTTQKYLHLAYQMKFYEDVYKLDEKMFKKIHM